MKTDTETQTESCQDLLDETRKLRIQEIKIEIGNILIVETKTQ